MTLEPSIDNLRELEADLAADLAAIASPVAPSGLASRALASTSRGGSGGSGGRGPAPLLRHFGGDWKHAAALGAICLVVFVVVVGVMLPSVGRARASYAVSAPASESYRFAADRLDTADAPIAGGMMDKNVAHLDDQNFKGIKPGSTKGQIADRAPARQVIRTANLEVRVANVRDSYQNASSLVREDLGEFISQTTFSGVEPYTAATVTLRVNADRLQSVLQSLRGLGDVTSESTGGEDVTDQLVDLDARLRNERRIEQELLTLLDTRNDAPLEDILKVREHLGRIRENIERLAAQQAQLTNRVALATITAQLVAKSEPIARQEGLLDYLGSELGAAWRWSLRALIDTISFLLAVIVGGLIWWSILGAIALLVRRAWGRHKRRLAAEPPPAI